MADIQCPLRASATVSGNQPALLSGEFSLTYTELDLVTSNTASRMSAAGIGPGSRVALRMPADRRTMVLLAALWRAGAVACPLSPRWPGDRLAELLLQVAARHLLVDEPDDEWPLPRCVRVHEREEILSRKLTLEEPDRERRFDLDQPATIVFTSGSTGRPQAVLHTIGNHYYSARGANYNLRLRSNDRWLLTLPFDHVSGLGILFRCFEAGAAVVLPAEGESLGRCIAGREVSHVSMVDTQLRRALRDEEDRKALAGMKGGVVLGGGPIDPALVREAREAGIAVYPSYGLTEMASQVTTVAPDSPPDQRDSAGRLLRHRELELAEDGEILVRGATLCQGVVEGEAVLPLEDADGWYHTGDLGTWENGHLRVWGRRDNRFVSGGENIAPEAVEEVIRGETPVQRVVVVGVPDEEFGRRPVAIGDWDADADLEELADRIRRMLPSYSVPIAWLDWPDAPAAEGLKPDRPRLAEYAAQKLGRGA